mgnify:CR=1 FL=1
MHPKPKPTPRPQIPVGGKEACTFVTKLPTAAAGDITVTVTEADGKQTESAVTPYSFESAVKRPVANAPDCAMVTTVGG